MSLEEERAAARKIMDETRRFHRNYRQWLDDCLVEFNEKFGPGSHPGERSLHQLSVNLEDYDPDDLVEFGEDGNAFPHSKGGGTNCIWRAVTPWRRSEHFC